MQQRGVYTCASEKFNYKRNVHNANHATQTPQSAGYKNRYCLNPEFRKNTSGICRIRASLPPSENEQTSWSCRIYPVRTALLRRRILFNRRNGFLMKLMTTSVTPKHTLFDELKPGDRIEVEHTVTVGQDSWLAKRCGTVMRTERRRHGMHHRRNFDDKVFSDAIILELPDGELTSITIDEFTSLRRA
jgi:hypothetical protein